MVISVINVQVTRVIIISAVRPSCIINIKEDKQGFILTLLDWGLSHKHLDISDTHLGGHQRHLLKANLIHIHIYICFLFYFFINLINRKQSHIGSSEHYS